MFRRFFERAAYAMARFMYGRYGVDALSKAITVTALILMLVGVIVPFVNLIGLVLMMWSIIRMYSKNIEKRRRELDKYLKITGGVRTKWRLTKRKFKERKTHRYFRCKTCKAVIRVPKGRGEINVGCPRCKNRVTMTT